MEFPRIANIYGSDLGPESSDVHLRMLARYDLLIGWLHKGSDGAARKALNERIARLRELKPGIIVLDFSMSAPYTRTAEPQPPDEAFLRSTDGERVIGWPGTQMLNLASPAAVEFLHDSVISGMEGLDVDGVFIDCMESCFDRWAVRIETPGDRGGIDADGDGVEDDPAALDAAWAAAKGELLRRLRGALGEKPIIHVNAQHQSEYARAYVNGNFLEDYIDATIADHGSGLQWPYVHQQHVSWCDTPHRPNVTTLSATPGFRPEYQAYSRLAFDECSRILQSGYEQLRRMRFGLATALMGDGFFGFDLNARWRGQLWWYAEYDAPLGRALGAATAFGDGTWRREFEGGLAVVNPSPREVAVELDGRWRDYTTGLAGKKFLVPPRDGRIYVPAGL